MAASRGFSGRGGPSSVYRVTANGECVITRSTTRARTPVPAGLVTELPKWPTREPVTSPAIQPATEQAMSARENHRVVLGEAGKRPRLAPGQGAHDVGRLLERALADEPEEAD
jgi:hypothetical protein